MDLEDVAGELWSAFAEVAIDAAADLENPRQSRQMNESDPVNIKALRDARQLIRDGKPSQAAVRYRLQVNCSPAEALAVLGLRR